MKHFLGFLIAVVVVMKVFELAPLTMAPVEKEKIQASIMTAPASGEKISTPETKTLLTLLEIAIDQEHNFEKGLDIIDQAPLTDDNQKLIQLYEAKILARTLDFEKAQQLLQTLNHDDMVMLKAAVLIANSDRNQVGAYLHDVADHHPDPEIKLTALSLLNIYRTFDSHREADESYLWTLFAQKLGDLGELEISLYLAEKAIAKNPEYRDAWIIKAYDELTLKRADEAELSLLTAYRLDPGNHHIQYLLGLTYFELNKPELSSQYLLYARQGEPQYENTILEKLAENAIRTEDYPLASHYLEELLTLAPNQEQILSRQIWLQTEHLNQLEKALENAKYLVGLSPSPENYKMLSWVTAKKGDTETATAELQKALE
jgi:Tfp pilus assembly protein PilF